MGCVLLQGPALADGVIPAAAKIEHAGSQGLLRHKPELWMLAACDVFV